MNFLFRVHFEIGYREAIFDFESPEEACSFAMNMVEHMIDSEDAKKKKSIMIEVVDKEAQEDEVQSDN